ncbi:MAG: hypothetical protein H6711_09655 [Myxococcales bacterium]|nr:hypothetical protein [Myxococcales bacterium]
MTCGRSSSPTPSSARPPRSASNSAPGGRDDHDHDGRRAGGEVRPLRRPDRGDPAKPEPRGRRELRDPGPARPPVPDRPPLGPRRGLQFQDRARGRPGRSGGSTRTAGPSASRSRLPRPTYESPKLTECAKRVAASPHCGHIIFCEPTACHKWLRQVLVDHGIDEARIAVLNAEETGPADRIRIAREFNGLSSEPPAPGTCARPSDSAIAPKYDVVIANSVAYEGVDLQVRTCAIHHADLTWTPADLEQRNGRGFRQGNTLGTVQIFYYFADGSTDGYRFSLIDGKAGWLGELIKSQVRDTNNPAAQQQLTPEDILLMISRNKEKTRALLEGKAEAPGRGGPRPHRQGGRAPASPGRRPLPRCPRHDRRGEGRPLARRGRAAPPRPRAGQRRCVAVGAVDVHRPRDRHARP